MKKIRKIRILDLWPAEQRHVLIEQHY